MLVLSSVVSRGSRPDELLDIGVANWLPLALLLQALDLFGSIALLLLRCHSLLLGQVLSLLARCVELNLHLLHFLDGLVEPGRDDFLARLLTLNARLAAQSRLLRTHRVLFHDASAPIRVFLLVEVDLDARARLLIGVHLAGAVDRRCARLVLNVVAGAVHAILRHGSQALLEGGNVRLDYLPLRLRLRGRE